MNQVSRRAGFLLIGAVLVSACSRKQVEPAPPPVAVVTDDDAARRDSIARAEAARRDSIERAERARAERERRMAEMRALIAAPVFFNYDRADITPESRQTLDAKLPLLRSNTDLQLRLEGHADDRGSDEYNLALGQRRAAAVWHYFVNHGIAEGRLQMVSYGEERPACQATGEECWRQNRRVEFQITAGADRIAAEPR